MSFRFSSNRLTFASSFVRDIFLSEAVTFVFVKSATRSGMDSVAHVFLRNAGWRSGFTEEADDGLHLTGREDFLTNEPALTMEGVAQHTAGLQLAVEALASPGVGTEGVVEGGQLRRTVGAKSKGVFHGNRV